MRKLDVKIFLLSLALLLTVITSTTAQTMSPLARDGEGAPKRTCLPTGVCLDAAGRSFDVGNMPLAMALAPEGNRLVLSLNGWREQGLQVVEPNTGRIVQTLPQAGAFYGLAFSKDGGTLYVSGGNEDVVYRYNWHDGQATLAGQIVLAVKDPKKDGTRFPAGLALSPDGRKLYVAENLADSLAVVDLETGKVEQRLPTGPYPYAVAVTAAGKVFVTAWGADIVSVFSSDGGGRLKAGRKIEVGRHPSALLLNSTGSRLFVASATTNRIAVIDTKSGRVLVALKDEPPSKSEGSTPNALALSADGTKLFVAEADNNAVAVFSLSKIGAGAGRATGLNQLMGRIPVEWYPTGLLVVKDNLLVLNGKGKGTRPNPQFIQPGEKMEDDNPYYTLGQLNGTIVTLPAELSPAELTSLTRRVAQNNNWNQAGRNEPKYPPFKHVIYIIKENRTYDQVFGDIKAGDGDPTLQFFPPAVSPNHHALAERFGLFDRFFVNAEVSSQGHVWSTAAYVTDYGEKTIPSQYANRRNPVDRDDADEPAAGYIWNAAIRKGLSLRNYGEFGEEVPNKDKNAPVRYRATKAALNPYTNPEYPVFDMQISDQRRVDVWLRDFNEFVKKGNLPALEIMHLPRDHTGGARPGWNTPKACFADNDYALGRLVEAVSHSPYWKDTVFFVLEDDSQDGPDHIDSHRSVMFTISAYNRAGTIKRFVNTTDVFATMEEILGLPPLSQFDFYGRPLRGIFSDTPDLRPYTAIKPEQSLDEVNPPRGPNAQASMKLDLDEVDRADMDSFNRILWSELKGGNVPYPGTKRMPSLEITRGR